VSASTTSVRGTARSGSGGTTFRPGSRRQHEVTRLLPGPMLAIILTVLSAIVLIPVAYIFLASVNSDIGVANGEFWPSTFSLENYTKIWSSVGLAKGLGNSVLVAGATAVVSAAMSVSIAYVLVRYQFRGRLSILRGLLALQSVPGTLMVLPVFVLFSSAASYLGVQVIGTQWGLFITYLTFAMPFSTWVMVTYLRGLPRELEEAARIDGASNLGVLVRIILPLSWPGIVVSGIFACLGDDPARQPDGSSGPPGVRSLAGRRSHSPVRANDGGLARVRGTRRDSLPDFPTLPSGRPDRRRS